MAQDTLLEERKAQLREISDRRSLLLREMFQMLRRKQDFGTSVVPDSQADEPFEGFLGQFDLDKNPDTGFIGDLPQSELFALPIPPATDTPVARSTRSRSRASASISPIVAHRPLRPSTSPQLTKHELPKIEEDDAMSLGTATNEPEEEPKQPEGPNANDTSPLENQTSDAMSVDPPAVPAEPLPLKQEKLGKDTVSWDDVLSSVLNRQRESDDEELGVAKEAEKDSGGRTVRPADLDLSLSGSNHLSSSLMPLQPGNTNVRRVLSSENEFKFDEVTGSPPSSRAATSPSRSRLQFTQNYTLPSLSGLPKEFYPKKSKRKRKEKERNENRKIDDWTATSFSEWNVMVRANPVWKKTSRSTKCLTTRDWSIAFSELRLIRTFDRIEALKDFAKWSSRQPKKQRGVGGFAKSHWDHLMDEMKWMRTDFREERKWKLALAYNLSTAVLEWHAAGSQEVRIAKGIIGVWRKPDPSDLIVNQEEEETPLQQEPAEASMMEVDSQEVEKREATRAPPTPEQPKNSLMMIDYGSDDDDDDDDKQSAVDALETAALVQESLDSGERPEEPRAGLMDLEPKKEELEGAVPAEETLMDVDPASSNQSSQEGTTSSGIKDISSDPPAPSKSGNDDPPANPTGSPAEASKSAVKGNPYAALRDSILFAEEDQLIIDLTNYKPSNPSEANDVVEIPPPDLSALFPEAVPFTMLEPSPPVVEGKDGKRRSDKKGGVEDPYKRIEETNFTRLYPAGNIMHVKPTLLGPLQPSKRWKNNQWQHWDDNVPVPMEGITKPVDESGSELFDPKVSFQLHTAAAIHNLERIPPRDKEKVKVEPVWNDADDILLKSIIDKCYGNFNWPLIANYFNSSRMTVSTDKRSPRDCFERWKEKWPLEPRSKAAIMSEAQTAFSPPSGNQVNTRGLKRQASTSISSQTGPLMETSGESKKRKRHVNIEFTMRKAAKKRSDQIQRMQATQNKKPSVHETHAQYGKLPKHGPAELSRLKSDNERTAKEQTEATRKRQEELRQAQQAARQQQQLHPQQAQGQPPVQGPQQLPQQQQSQPAVPGQPQPQPQGQGIQTVPVVQQQQQQQQPQQQQQQAQVQNPQQQQMQQQVMPRPPSVAGRVQQQPQPQVNISGQQRMATNPAAVGNRKPVQPVYNMVAGSMPQQSSPPPQYNQQHLAAGSANVGRISPQHQFTVPTGPSSSPPHHSSPPRSSATPANPHLHVQTQPHPRPPSAQAQVQMAGNPMQRHLQVGNVSMASHVQPGMHQLPQGVNMMAQGGNPNASQQQVQLMHALSHQPTAAQMQQMAAQGQYYNWEQMVRAQQHVLNQQQQAQQQQQQQPQHTQ